MTKDSKEEKFFKNIANHLKFTRSTIGDFVLISDKINVPIYTNNERDTETVSEVETRHYNFIKILCSQLSVNIDVAAKEHDLHVSEETLNFDTTVRTYMDKVKIALDPNGTYKDQYELISQLTEFKCRIGSDIRIGLVRISEESDTVIPVIVLQIKMKAVCKLNNIDNDKSHILILDTYVIN